MAEYNRATPKDIFISYGQEQDVKEFVDKVSAEIEKAGWSTFVDRKDITAGDTIMAEVGSAIMDCQAVVAVITLKYLNSKWCETELINAYDGEKIIFPIILGDRIPDEEMKKTKHGPSVSTIIKKYLYTQFKTKKYEVDPMRKLLQGISKKLGQPRNGQEDMDVDIPVGQHGNGQDNVDAGIPVGPPRNGQEDMGVDIPVGQQGNGQDNVDAGIPGTEFYERFKHHYTRICSYFIESPDDIAPLADALKGRRLITPATAGSVKFPDSTGPYSKATKMLGPVLHALKDHPEYQEEIISAFRECNLEDIITILESEDVEL